MPSGKGSHRHLLVIVTSATMLAIPASATASVFVSQEANAAVIDMASPSDWTDIPTVTSSVSPMDLPYESPDVTDIQPRDDNQTEDGMSLGDEVAWLAVQMAATASPDERPTAPGHDVWSKSDDPRCSNLFAVMDALEAVCPAFNCAYASCNQAACAVLSAVVDMDMTPHDAASGGPSLMLEWLRGHPENWQHIDSHDEEELRPGDVICSQEHTAIYVGHEFPQQRFPGTTGSIYEASFSMAAYAGINDFYIADDAEVYRPIRKNNDSVYQPIDIQLS